MKYLFRAIRRFFKRNLCPVCGAMLDQEKKSVLYAAGYGEDPPYGGTCEVISRFCSRCPWESRKEVSLDIL